MNDQKNSSVTIVQTVISGLTLVISFFALIGAIYIGVMQNSINEKLLNLNYEPSLTASYDSSIGNSLRTGLSFTNTGKSNIEYYGYTLTTSSDDGIPQVLETHLVPIDDRHIILQGATVYDSIKTDWNIKEFITKNQDYLQKNRTFYLLTYFKTADEKKYVLKMTFNIEVFNEKLIMTYGQHVYIPYEWKER